jgi:5,10-methylenetetrahydromethanopterin reductase
MQGEIFRVSGAKLNFKVANPIPIFIGAQGPKMLALAGEIGDGVLINSSDSRDVEDAMKSIYEGAKKAGKKLDDLSIGVYSPLSVASNYEQALQAVVPVVAYIVAGSPETILERHGIPVELASKIRNSIVQAKWKKAFSYVDDNVVEAFSICGTPEKCVEKMDRLVKTGVNQLVVGSPIGPNMRKSMDMIAKQIFPHFKKQS